MPLFLTEEELSLYANDAVAVAEKADAFICELYKEVDTVRAQADAAAITAEQTCSLLEQKYLSLSAEFSKLESQNAQLQSSLDQRLSDLAQVQTEKHQLHLQSVRTRFLSYSIVILSFFWYIYVDICVCGFR
jgi:nucleoprotein TPR